jgi:hypothetical protein
MLRARATLGRAVQPGGVVITTEEVGRPAENIDHYSGVAHALYLTDLERWRVPIPEAALALARGGMVPYLLLPLAEAARAAILRDLGGAFSVELVADIPAGDAISYFVVAPSAGGAHMALYRLVPRGG